MADFTAAHVGKLRERHGRRRWRNAQVARPIAAPLEVVVAQAEVASREEGIITTEALIQNTQDKLKNLIYGTNQDQTEALTPSDEPQAMPLDITVEEAVQRVV